MDYNKFIAQHIQELPKSGIRKFFDLVNLMDNVISLGVGEPDFATPWEIREAAIYSLEKGHTSYTSNLGLLSLRKEICRYLKDEDFNVEYNPVDECIITVGVSEALDLALRALINIGDEVIYHEPCYVSYNAEIKMAHGVPVKIETNIDNEFSLDAKQIAEKITPKTKAIILNFPCNPTGATLNNEQMTEISKLAVEHDLIVLTDEIYSELTYEERLPSIASYPGMRERTIFLHGFSKAYAMTGFRVGFACGPKELIDAMMKIHQYTMLCASITSQEAALEALRNSKKSMLMMKNEYMQRRNYFVKRFNEMGLRCYKPRGSFYLFVEVTSTKLSSLDFAEKLLEEERVAVVPGTAFGSCGEGFVRCCYAMSLEEIKVATDRIERFVKNMKD
ncbi:aminotransferase class I/II-fold pyridoxal phosphate-dependent enzyme [Lentisphaerota bacterium WC36G]|nr:aminotransferase class I/II-fold pyridoxal phosphate-dependent enzyme [Lentisphaerae bacterium WC36]